MLASNRHPVVRVTAECEAAISLSFHQSSIRWVLNWFHFKMATYDSLDWISAGERQFWRLWQTWVMQQQASIFERQWKKDSHNEAETEFVIHFWIVLLRCGLNENCLRFERIAQILSTFYNFSLQLRFWKPSKFRLWDSRLLSPPSYHAFYLGNFVTKFRIFWLPCNFFVQDQVSLTNIERIL